MYYLKAHFARRKNCKYVYFGENNNLAILRKNGKMAMACEMLCIEKKIRAVAMALLFQKKVKKVILLQNGEPIISIS